MKNPRLKTVSLMRRRRPWPAHMPSRAGHQMRAHVRMRTFASTARMVEHGVGVAVIPQSAARRLRLGADLRRLALADDWADRRLVLCVRSLAAAPGYVQALRA